MTRTINLDITGLKKDEGTEMYRHAVIIRVREDGSIINTDGLRRDYENGIMKALSPIWPQIIELGMNPEKYPSELKEVIESMGYRYMIASVIESGDYLYYRSGRMPE